MKVTPYKVNRVKRNFKLKLCEANNPDVSDVYGRPNTRLSESRAGEQGQKNRSRSVGAKPERG